MNSKVLLISVLVVYAIFETSEAQEKAEVIDLPSKACACPLIYDPICGSDGRTYGNDCELRCDRDSGVTLLHKGECQETRCPCPKILRPVCGSNGRTYGNVCLLRCAMKKFPKLSLEKRGEC